MNEYKKRSMPVLNVCMYVWTSEWVCEWKQNDEKDNIKKKEKFYTRVLVSLFHTVTDTLPWKTQIHIQLQQNKKSEHFRSHNYSGHHETITTTTITLPCPAMSTCVLFFPYPVLSYYFSALFCPSLAFSFPYSVLLFPLPCLALSYLTLSLAFALLCPALLFPLLNPTLPWPVLLLPYPTPSLPYSFPALPCPALA